MAPLIALVPNTGAGIGLGHLERMLALADALALGSETIVVTGPDGPEGDRVLARGLKHRIGQGSWSQRATETVAALRPAVAVLDGYRLDLQVQAELRRQSSIVIIDDTNGSCDADLLVNPAPGGESIEVPAGAAQVLAGGGYALIARGYIEARGIRDRDGFDPTAIAVVSGGADIGHLQAELLTALREAIPGATLHVAVGPRGSTPDPAGDVVVHAAPATLATLLAGSALYVGTAGTSAVQAACVGVPAVLVVAADNQARQAAALAAVGCAVALPLGAGPVDAAALAGAIAADDSRATAMSAAGRRVVDGRGSERVAAAILELALARQAP